MSDTDKSPKLDDALDDMRESVAAFTYDGDRTNLDHLSGEPVRRSLVLGDDDPRDAALAERPLTEDVAWTGRIFNVDACSSPTDVPPSATWCATPGPSPSSRSPRTAASASCASTAPRSDA